MGNYTEFVRAVWMVSDALDFHVDLNVSVFETTIRVLGGLLSGHILAEGLDASNDGVDDVREMIEVAFSSHTFAENGTLRGKYDGSLLRLAVDVANRMLPAFETVTGIPIGTVNLMKGVPVGETVIASTAGGGSLYMEFGMLSSLTGNASYALKSRQALIALYELAEKDTGLVGMHVNTKDGKWTEKLAGVGSNIDSFYEYLYKVRNFCCCCCCCCCCCFFVFPLPLFSLFSLLFLFSFLLLLFFSPPPSSSLFLPLPPLLCFRSPTFCSATARCIKCLFTYTIRSNFI
jgi:mannosidase alpha-like ER degradation enhancer 2